MLSSVTRCRRVHVLSGSPRAHRCRSLSHGPTGFVVLGSLGGSAGVVAMNVVGDRVRRDRALWIQCGCTELVALGAAYASYRHGREFVLRFSADASTASIWPLIVDGLLTTATVELWKNGHSARAGGRWAAWLAFGFGISLSLCANIGSASRLSVFGVLVAACPPLAVLLPVELLNGALKRRRGRGCACGYGSCFRDRRRE